MRIISTPDAPQAIGPYSQAVKNGGIVYCSGQIPLDPRTGELCAEDIQSQTQCVLDNLAAVLAAAGATKENVLKTTVYLSDMENFPAMNEVYATFFGRHKPARATVEVSRLPKDVLVEIDCIADTL